MDEEYFMYAEEVDWCYRLRHAGWQVYYSPVPITHLGGGSSRERPTQREADLYCGRVRFFRKHYGPARAALLKGMIYAVTAAKLVAHGILRRVSLGRLGRRVPGLVELHSALADV
jgi:GT2 family glycosyltransferase